MSEGTWSNVWCRVKPLRGGRYGLSLVLVVLLWVACSRNRSSEPDTPPEVETGFVLRAGAVFCDTEALAIHALRLKADGDSLAIVRWLDDQQCSRKAVAWPIHVNEWEVRDAQLGFRGRRTSSSFASPVTLLCGTFITLASSSPVSRLRSVRRARLASGTRESVDAS